MTRRFDSWLDVRRYIGFASAFVLLLATPTAAITPVEAPRGTFGKQIRILEEPVLAPDYIFREAGGREWGFLEFRGQVLVATIWATWCGVCRTELPKLDALEADLGASGIHVIALAQDADAEAVRATLKKRGLKHLRPFQDVDSVITSTLGVFGVPTSFVIRPDGHIIGVVQGGADWDSPEARDFLKSLAGVSPKTQPTSAIAP